MHSVALCRQHREKERERAPLFSYIFLDIILSILFLCWLGCRLVFYLSRERAGRGIKNDASVELIGLFGRRFRWPLHIHKLENEPKKKQARFIFVLFFF
jgi:hypothetical protein